jgi:hypothetical protein
MSRISRRRGLTAGLALAALLALGATFAATATASSHHGIEPDHRIWMGTSNPDRAYEAFDAVTLAAVDLSGDGHKEIVAHNDNKHGYVFDGVSDQRIAELATNHPDGWAVRPLGGPAIGDVTGNGVHDIVLVNSAAWVTAFEARPTGDHRQLDVTELWATRMDPAQQDPEGDWEAPGTDAPPFLADANDGGRDGVYAQLDDQAGLYKLTPDGHVDAWKDWGDGNAGPIVADLTGDGDEEVVYSTDGGDVFVFDAATMNHHCDMSARAQGAWPASISASPTAADLTGDGRLEIVFGVRNVPEDAPYEGWEDDSDAHYFAVDADCNVVWQKTWAWSNPHVHMHPVPVDVTGDGSLDVVFQDWNTVGHKPGEWQHTGPSNLFAVEGQSGELIWRTEVQNYWSNKNVAAGDVTGDGRVEILANEVDSGDGIGLYSLAGDKKGFVPAPDGWVVSRGPTLADLDDDGGQEMILPVHRDSDHCQTQTDGVGCREGALQIYDTPGGGDPVYDNNHLLNADEERARGGPAPPPDDGDGTSGEFEASFTNVRGNEWWIETDVDSSSSIASVHARVDGGDWHRLDHRDWGSWADDIHAPEGAIVEFQARNDAGDRSLSGCYSWGEDPSATSCPDDRSSGDDGSGAGGDLEASFVNVRGNEWWLETEVDSERSITDVEVRLDGGDWLVLEKRDWGSWARSEHAPEGTLVQFRAHAGDEATARSGCYAWGEDPSPTSCPDGASGGSTSGSSFPAEFAEPRGNEWWIETDVESSSSIASVSARVDGGDWFRLDRTDWGSWARNTHVGQDVTVEFRATSDAGATATSQPYAWPP